MKASIMDRLMCLTEEEARLAVGDSALRRELYSRTTSFLIEKERLLVDVYGPPDSPLLLRKHTRYADIPLHFHDYIEMMYVCNGQITHEIGQDAITLKKGDIIILGRSTMHSLHRAAKDDIGVNMIIAYDFYSALCNRLRSSILLSDKIFTRMMQPDGNPYCVFHTAGIEEVENLLENILLTLFSGDRKKDALLQLEFELLTSYLASLPDVRSEVYGKERREERAVRQLNRYIETAYPRATLSEAAERLGFTPNYLCRWVKRNYGVTFKQLLTEKRFAVALELLTDSSLSVGEIIETVGYENRSYFHKEFLRRFGKTPKELRDEQRGAST